MALRHRTELMANPIRPRSDVRRRIAGGIGREIRVLPG